MAKTTKQGVGMTERVVVQRDVSDFNDPKEFAVAFFEYMDANCIPKNVRAENANRSRDILSEFGIEWGNLESLRQVDEYPENHSVTLAAEWLRTFHHVEQLKQSAATGDKQAISDLISEAEHLGVIQERMWWRCQRDYSTGKPRESLALSGRDQVKGGINGNAMKTQNSFATQYGAEAQAMADDIFARNSKLSWTAIRKTIATKYGVSTETVKNALLNPKKNNKGG